MSVFHLLSTERLFGDVTNVMATMKGWMCGAKWWSSDLFLLVAFFTRRSFVCYCPIAYKISTILQYSGGLYHLWSCRLCDTDAETCPSVLTHVTTTCIINRLVSFVSNQLMMSASSTLSLPVRLQWTAQTTPHSAKVLIKSSWWVSAAVCQS